MAGRRAYHEAFKDLLLRERGVKRAASWGGAPPARLRIYRHNAHTNWKEALDQDFPLTRKQFTPEAWEGLRRRYFTRHPPRHWELNTALAPFVGFLKREKVPPHVKELADYEWSDLRVFIDRRPVQKGRGVTNPTALVRTYRHQIFFWADQEAPVAKPPPARPEALVFFRDAENACHIREADPLMLLIMDHFKKRGARLAALEPIRRRLLPANQVPLSAAFERLTAWGLLL
jgi:hypothetical protein